MAIKRRDVIRMVAASAAAGLPFAAFPQGRESVIFAEYGGSHVEGSKKVATAWTKSDITWAGTPGGGAALLGKIKAAVPNAPFDLIDSWSPVFVSLVKEGWAETVTPADVPNIADVPAQYLAKDAQGNIKCIPRSVDGSLFAVRSDRCPIEIKSIEDLLNPKLKGQICWPVPTLYMNSPTVLLSLARGGNEQNLDPGWKFLEELAKSGNIGRVYATAVEGTNSVTTGETSVIFASNGALAQLAERVQIKALTKIHQSLKAVLYTEGLVVLSASKKKKTALELANFLISKESSEAFHQIVHSVPVNPHVKPNPKATPIQFTAQEAERFAVLPDWAYMSTQVSNWMKKFEQDIAPKI